MLTSHVIVRQCEDVAEDTPSLDGRRPTTRFRTHRRLRSCSARWQPAVVGSITPEGLVTTPSRGALALRSMNSQSQRTQVLLVRAPDQDAVSGEGKSGIPSACLCCATSPTALLTLLL